MLTQQRLKELLDYDPNTGEFRWKSTRRNRIAGKIAGSVHTDDKGWTYRKICVDNRAYKAHRLAWLFMNNCWPTNQIDHINGNSMDNRIANLRDVTPQQNMQNQKRSKANTTGVTGVFWHKKNEKWIALIIHERKRIYLGSFANKQDAIAARKAAEAIYQPLKVQPN